MRMAKLFFAQYGGADSELSAGMRYLAQRYSMPLDTLKALLTDIGTEELGHWEMIGAMIAQLTAGATAQDYKAAGMGDYYVGHQNGIYPQDASGVPFTAAYIQVKGDPVADLTEDLAAEQKARATYESLMRITDDPDVIDPLRFLREREIVHFERFGEGLDILQRMHINCHTK